MERYSSSSNRLYSGPLSASGQKILAALRAQSHNRYSDTARAQSYRQHERYGSRPREYKSEASWSRGTQEKRRGREADRLSREEITSPHGPRSSKDLSNTETRPRHSICGLKTETGLKPWSRPQSYSQSSSSCDPSSQRDYSQTPALSQDSASSSTHRVRYPLALHTPSNEPHWRDAPEETEPTFSLHFALEDQGHSRPPLPRAEHPRPHREKPTGACGPPFSRANVSIAPKNHVKNLETRSEGWHLGSGDGVWQCPEHSQEETSITPEDQRERLAKAKPIEVALAGGGDADHRAPVPITKWQFGSIVLPPPQIAYKAEEKADCDKKRPVETRLLLPALESDDFTMKDMDSGPSFELRVEDDIGESCALEKDSFGASHTVERDGFRASHALERGGFGASQGLETDDFGASHTVERDGFGASHSMERDGFGASYSLKRDGFGASHALERNGFGASQGLETDDFGASHTVERDGFGASHSMERDGFGASHSLKRDGFGASHALERNGFGASQGLETDDFGTSHTVERDGFGASHSMERDGFGASHSLKRDGFGASHALERNGFGASQGLETDDFGASHTVERDGFGASHSMERDGFGASHSLKRDGLGASHALQRDGIGEKLLFNEGDVTKGHRDSTESLCVVGLVDQQGALHGDTAQSKEEIVTGGGPKENLSERDPIMRKRLFADMTTDNQSGMGGGEMEGRVERERKDDINKGGMKKKIERKNSRSSTKPHQQRKVSPSLGQMRDGEGQGVTERDSHPEERRKMDGPLVTAAQRNSGGNTEPLAAGHFIPKPSQESGRVFRAPPLRGTCLGQTPLVTNHHNNTQAGVGGSRERGLSIDPALTKPSLAGHGRAAGLGSSLTSIRASGEEESSGHHPLPPAQQPPLTPTFSIKSKHGAPLSKIALFRRPVKWEPPQSCQEKARTLQGGQKWCKTQTPKHPALTPAFSLDPRAKTKTLHKTEGTKSVALTPNPPHRPPANSVRPRQGVTMGERGLELTRDHSSSDTPQHRSSKKPKPPKLKRAKPDPNQGQLTPETEPEGGSGAGDPQAQSNQSKTCLTTAMISDPRVRDAGKLSPEERGRVLEEAGQASALVLTMVYQDGTTQMDPEQKLSPSVCGVLVMLKRDLDQTGPGPEVGVAQRDSLVYLRLEQKPAWAQSHQDHNLDLFNREMLLQVVSGSQLVVCYKAKDLLRTALQHYRPDLHWKQFSSCRVQDPQVAAWLLDPADPSSCFTNLLTKHCRTPPRTPTPALGARKVSQVITSLSLLYRLNMELRSKLQSQGLWELYSNMELTMIPVLAAMESHRIHVDTESLKTTSEMLGTKMKQLEHEAHQAAGQMFLVSSSTQLRTVLFEKLRLQERCENKKLPKTLNKQQQSTSEAVLLQLQDLHPLPKIILEYRQVHKIKSTFVDGVLSCMMSKNFISSTWYQTSAVTGRISAKHPNFQALPRQPVQITKKQYVQGKEAEVVTVHPRAMFIPQDGYTFLAADFCQVELRLLAHLSSDPELQRIFNNPQADVFTMLASQWKGVSEGEVSSEDREHAKRIVYSVVYGAGRERLSGILGVSAEQASHFQDSFLHTYREVQTFIHTTIQQCHKQGYVVSIMGRRRTLPHIHSTDWGVRMQAERQAVNFVVQGSAADLCKMAMIRIFSQVSSSSSLSARLIAQLHDELLYEVEDSQVGEFAVLVKNTMESLQHIDCLGVHLKVPLKVAVSSGKSWGSMSELHLPQTSLPPSS